MAPLAYKRAGGWLPQLAEAMIMAPPYQMAIPIAVMIAEVRLGRIESHACGWSSRPLGATDVVWPMSLRAHDEPSLVVIACRMEASMGATGVVEGIPQTHSVDVTEAGIETQSSSVERKHH